MHLNKVHKVLAYKQKTEYLPVEEKSESNSCKAGSMKQRARKDRKVTFIVCFVYLNCWCPSKTNPQGLLALLLNSGLPLHSQS